MSDFYKKFLLEDSRRLGAGGRYVGLAAFGKHPGWDDHVEDLGLETESLNLAKIILYVNGIGGQIDTGAWEKLDETQQLPFFNHLFLWQRSGQFLIGRLWSSSDGKGRKRYPMVVCLQFIGVTLGWALKHALPALDELERGCLAATTAEEVRTLLNRQRAALREVIQSADERGEYAPLPPDSIKRILNPSGGTPAEGFVRVLYQMQGQLGNFAPGEFNGRANPTTIRAQQIRVPAAGSTPGETLLFWTRFFQTQVDAAVPLLLALPVDMGWVDVTVGEPESHEFFCLRASPKSVPLVSEVPFTLDDTFRSKAASFLAGFERGETKAGDLKPAAAQPIDAPPGATGRWRKWLGVGLFLIFVAVSAAVLLTRKNKPAQQTGSAAPKTAAAIAAASDKAASVPTPASNPVATETTRSNIEAAIDAEATRLNEEKKKAEAATAAAATKKAADEAAMKKVADLAAAKKAADDAAAKEKARIAAEEANREKDRLAAVEAGRIAKEKAAAAAKALQEQAALDLEKKKEAQAKPAVQLVSDSTPEKTAAAPVTTAAVAAATPVQDLNQMTNSIGMVLVRVSKDLFAGKFEVTQAEYKKVMGENSNPSKSVKDDQPVERVSWNDAIKFTAKLTQLEHDKLAAGSTYSLPTEKQWKELSGGQKFEELPGRGITGKTEPASVGQSGPANKFGLFDVLGNVWEWCLDGATGEEKLLKGGAFNSANFDRTLLPDRQVSNCGFRCVLATH